MALTTRTRAAVLAMTLAVSATMVSIGAVPQQPPPAGETPAAPQVFR